MASNRSRINRDRRKRSKLDNFIQMAEAHGVKDLEAICKLTKRNRSTAKCAMQFIGSMETKDTLTKNNCIRVYDNSSFLTKHGLDIELTDKISETIQFARQELARRADVRAREARLKAAA